MASPHPTDHKRLTPPTRDKRQQHARIGTAEHREQGNAGQGGSGGWDTWNPQPRAEQEQAARTRLQLAPENDETVKAVLWEGPSDLQADAGHRCGFGRTSAASLITALLRLTAAKPRG